MVALKDILKRLADSQGITSFSAQHLGISLEDFQLIAERVRGAFLSGFVETIKEHRSSATGRVDCVWVDGLTDEGRAYLDNH